MGVQLLAPSQLQLLVTQIDPEKFGAAIGALVGYLIVALLIGHVSGKIAESVGGNYWLFGVLGCLFQVFGLLAALIYYAVKRPSKKKPASAGGQPQYPPGSTAGYPPQPPPDPGQLGQASVPKLMPEPGPAPVGASAIYQKSDFIPNPPMQRSTQAQPQAAESQQEQTGFKFQKPQIPPWEQTISAPSGLRTCAGCGADNPGTSPTCWRCGEKLDSKPAERTCTECGTPSEPLADYCKKCGAHLEIT